MCAGPRTSLWGDQARRDWVEPFHSERHLEQPQSPQSKCVCCFLWCLWCIFIYCILKNILKFKLGLWSWSQKIIVSCLTSSYSWPFLFLVGASLMMFNILWYSVFQCTNLCAVFYLWVFPDQVNVLFLIWESGLLWSVSVIK